MITPTRCALSLLMPIVALGLGSSALEPSASAQSKKPDTRVPRFQVDITWPTPPENWLIGHGTALAVDARNHVWVLTRPGSLSKDEQWATTKQAECCVPTPPVLEFDTAGNFIQAWGGRGKGHEWADTEHGLFVDFKDHVWTAGSGRRDGQVLKFSKTGNFLLQIGHKRVEGQQADSNDTTVLNQPANIFVHPRTNEVFVADGYGNRRVIVFDADTGAYKRHWGAYGHKPDDAAPRDRAATGNTRPVSEESRPPQFGLVHSVRISHDDLVYVADRANNRIQVFKIDGTFVKEGFIAKNTLANGTAADVAFSPDRSQQFLYVADGSNPHVWILNRQTLQIVGKFGRGGRNAGQFFWLHSIAVDHDGNIYTGEGSEARRFQKFLFKGFSSPSNQ